MLPLLSVGALDLVLMFCFAGDCDWGEVNIFCDCNSHLAEYG